MKIKTIFILDIVVVLSFLSLNRCSYKNDDSCIYFSKCVQNNQHSPPFFILNKKYDKRGCGYDFKVKFWNNRPVLPLYPEYLIELPFISVEKNLYIFGVVDSLKIFNFDSSMLINKKMTLPINFHLKSSYQNIDDTSNIYLINFIIERIFHGSIEHEYILKIKMLNYPFHFPDSIFTMFLSTDRGLIGIYQSYDAIINDNKHIEQIQSDYQGDILLDSMNISSIQIGKFDNY